MVLVDSHCHLEGRDFEAAGDILARAKAAGVIHAVVIGQFHQPGDFGSALQVAAAHPDFLSPTMGIHPHDAAKATAEDIAMLESICRKPEVVAVGETGLDYFYDHSPRPLQRESFARHCALSNALGKPLVVHVRDAHEDCQEILAAESVRSGVIHCFTGDTDAAKHYLDLGLYLSISGVVTYKKNEALQEAVRWTPLDRLMVETDTPYLAPVPNRGKRNEPAWVEHTVRKIAELKSLTAEEVALRTAQNAAALFRFSLPTNVSNS